MFHYGKNTNSIVTISFTCVYSRSGVIEKMEALELENQEKMEVEESGRSGGRQGRSEHRRFHREVCAFWILSILIQQSAVSARFAETSEDVGKTSCDNTDVSSAQDLLALLSPPPLIFSP